MSPLSIDLSLDARGAVVVRRPPERAAERGTWPGERFRGDDVGDSLAAALRQSPLLRSVRRIDLRILLETADVVLRVHAGSTEVRSSRTADGGLLAPSVLVPLRSGTSDAVLEVSLERELLSRLVAALALRRFVGTVRMELGSLVRSRAIIRALGPTAETRPGVILDVTRAAVTVVILDGSVSQVGAVPADDLRSALASAATAPLRSLVERERTGDRSGWVVVTADPTLRAGVLSACADLLPAGSRVDLARPRQHHRDRPA